MHPEQNPTHNVDEAVLDRARESIEEMHQLVQTLMVDLKDESGAAQMVALTINERILQLISDCEEAQSEEQMLNKELQRFQDK